ncbi:MAG TPA: FAD-dependent thymidylate synthase [Chloroflexota bacterium]
MAIVTEPAVYVVGRQQVDDTEVQRFLDYHGASWETDSEVGGELLSEMGGRVCYMAFGAKQGRRTNGEYLGNIMRQRHGSVLEHAVWTFLITGVSRSLTHELVRHRAGWAYSQLSQRYVDETETDFVEPAVIAAEPHLHGIWLESIEAARAAYVALSDALVEKLKIEQPELKATARRKAARQAARSVLPNATETKIFVTVNGRALRHFIELRGSEDAEPEIRTLAVALLRLMSREAPNMFGDFTLRTLADGSQATEVLHSKV